tara:strand:- start:936 stop:2555 length:1620 start_codon:yes stop_codon:yes gene_type:complete
MNKTLLLIICDFLLLNLIHFTAWDNVDKDNSVAGAGGAETLGSGMGDPSQDLELVKFQLEQSEREKTATEQKLDRTEGDLTQSKQQNIATEKELGNVKEKLGDREKALGNAEKMNLAILSEYEQFKEKAQDEAEQSNEENQKLVEEVAKLGKENKTLTSDLNEKNQKVNDLSKDLLESQALAKERLRTANEAENRAIAFRKDARAARNEAKASLAVAEEANIRAGKAEANALQAMNRIKGAEDRAQVAQNRVVEVESNLAAAKTKSQDLAQAKERAEKITEELTNKISEKIPDQPINANTMATLFSKNYLNFNTQAKRTLSKPDYSVKTILIEAPTYDYAKKSYVPYVHAISHVYRTPFRINQTALGWKETYGQLSKAGRKTHELHHVRFLKSDPRIIVAPIGPPDSTQVKNLGVTPYKLILDWNTTFKFPKAFIMSSTSGKYGDIEFKIDLTNPSYVKVDRIVFNFGGKFNPSRGDLVFGQKGRLLGIMANSEYCHLIKSIDPAPRGAITFGKSDYSKVAQTLGSMSQLIAEKPAHLR